MAPLRNPRTLWAWHPVAAMRSFRVAPFGWRSSARIAAFLLPSRAPWPSLAAFPSAPLGTGLRPLALLVALLLPTSSSASASHIYQNAGGFTAVLTVTDNLGAIGTAQVAITVDRKSTRLNSSHSQISYA